MNSRDQKSKLREISSDELVNVSGGAIPVVLVAAGAGVGFGYAVGRDRALRDNRND